ncbi:hypothetical protein [Brevundimonas sp.]|uniref:hypothetical protein n=1 Tax=Brevundimonas sp. TaxID=1871086 RepID=UPI0035AEB332
MKILAAGNSHIASLKEAHAVAGNDTQIDFVPLNLTGGQGNAIVRGRGRITFAERSDLKPIDIVAADYDALVIVGAFIGGDGIFRSLVNRSCFTALRDDKAVAAVPATARSLGTNGRWYHKARVLAPKVPGIQVSEDVARAAIGGQIAERLEAFQAQRLRSLYKRVIWFESPFPKRSVFRLMWGPAYSASGEAKRLHSIYRDELLASSLRDMVDFVEFPDYMTEEDGIHLLPEFSLTPGKLDIHAGAEFGRWMLDQIEERCQSSTI